MEMRVINDDSYDNYNDDNGVISPKDSINLTTTIKQKILKIKEHKQTENKK